MEANTITLDKDWIVAALKEQPDIFPLLPEDAREDEDIIVAALSSQSADAGEIYQMLSESAKAKKNVALQAVREYSYIYREIPKELQNDRDIALAAVSRNKAMYWDVPKSLCTDRELVLLALSSKLEAPQVYLNLPEEAKEGENGRLFALKAVQTGHVFRGLPEKFKKDREIATEYAAANPRDLTALGDLEYDKQVILEAIKKNHDVYWNSEFLFDPECARAAIPEYAARRGREKMRKRFRETVMKACAEEYQDFIGQHMENGTYDETDFSIRVDGDLSVFVTRNERNIGYMDVHTDGTGAHAVFLDVRKNKEKKEEEELER